MHEIGPQESGSQKGRRLQSDRDGPFFTGFLPHSYGYGAANPAKTVLAGVTSRFDAFCRPDSLPLFDGRKPLLNQ